jgi:subfamily B ATP-binding cassette protein MsbA
MKIVAARTLSTSAVQFLTAISLSLTLYVATLDIADSLLTPGGFVAMVAAMLALLKPMKDFAFVQNKLYRGLAGAQSVFELLDEAPEEDRGRWPLIRAKGKIQFSHVSFNYGNHKEVLDDINFTLSPGEVVALVGRSGSGKSTIVSLLSRFYDNPTGEILLDEVGEADIEAAARASYAMEFIEKLPDGLQTLVGENGVLLSGGQRQRIAIARAIIQNAPILILDEATSALDTESERYIQTALEALMKQRTTLIIAHRLSTVEHADRIIVMENGRIVEVGSHKQLLVLEGAYAKLYRMQFSDNPIPLETVNQNG